MQYGVQHWNNETFKEGQARLADLLAQLTNEVAKLDMCMFPLNKQLNLAKKAGLAQVAQKRAARWSLAKPWEYYGMGKHWLNLLIELKLVNEEEDDNKAASTSAGTSVCKSVHGFGEAGSIPKALLDVSPCQGAHSAH